MTIYTPSAADKKPDKDVTEPEVVTEPLTGEKDKEVAAAAAIELRVNYLRAKRRSAFMHMLLAIMVVTVLGLGIIGCGELYKHLNKKTQVYEGWCGTQYYDEIYHNTAQPDEKDADPQGDEVPMDFFKETYVITPDDNIEEFYTPVFDDVMESHVFHDFGANLTVITDNFMMNCYVTMLKEHILRPSDFVIRIDEVTNSGTTRRTVVIQEDYILFTPIRPFSNRLRGKIADICRGYDTYWLNMVVFGTVKRSTGSEKVNLGKRVGTYAVLSNNPEHLEMYKMHIYHPKAE